MCLSWYVPNTSSSVVPAAMHNEAAADSTADIPGWQDAGEWIVKMRQHPLDLLVSLLRGRSRGGGYQTISKILLL